MAYRVIPVKRLTGPQFKILFEWFVKGKRNYRAIPKAKWEEHGFKESMTLEEAKRHKDSKNAIERFDRKEKRRQQCLAREQEERRSQSAFLPQHYRDEFEANKIPESKKGKSYWRTAALIINAVPVLPKDWVDNTERFYKEFLKRQMSPSTVKTILPFINKWGMFYSRKLSQPFDKIPSPPRNWAAMIAEAHYERGVKRGNRESDPLTPEMLKAAKVCPAPEYRWWAFSVWFGLRPIEVDLLSQESGKRTWRVENGALWIYQTKLKGVKPEKRCKVIPAKEAEQRELLADMSLPVSRPKSSLWKDVTLYGGRKGFIALMKSRGHKFEEVSAWLGHQNINRTYQSYFDKTAA